MNFDQLSKSELIALVGALASLIGYFLRQAKAATVRWWHRVWGEVEEEQGEIHARITRVEEDLDGRISQMQRDMRARMSSMEDSLVQLLDEETEERRREVGKIRRSMRELGEELKIEMRSTRSEVITQLESVRQALMARGRE